MVTNQQLQPDLQAILTDRLRVTQEEIAYFCQRWQIAEFSLFGSVLRDDFRAESDVDVLVVFAPNRPSRGFDDYVAMPQELATLLGRSVDVVEKQHLRNPYRRANILNSYQTIYASE